jgi:uncharacterized protein YciI
MNRAATARRQRSRDSEAPAVRWFTLWRMFVVLLTYVKPVAEIDRLMKEHVRFLQQQYDAGLFVASGRRVPRTGGVILARGTDKQTLEAIMTGDPFVHEGAARFEVIEFTPSQTRSGFKPFT